MSNNFSILNSYPKGNSNIRGEFLILNEDPSLCLTFTEEESSETFISEEGVGSYSIGIFATIIFPDWNGWQLYNVPPAYNETFYPSWNGWTLLSSQI